MRNKNNRCAYREYSLSLFVAEEHVMRIQERLFDSEKPPIDVSDMSLLVTSLAWGALLDSEVDLVSKVALLDTVLEISTMLQRPNSSVRQFLVCLFARS